MATYSVNLGPTPDSVTGTDSADIIYIGNLGRLESYDSLVAGDGQDTLEFVGTSVTIHLSKLLNSSGWDVLDFKAANVSLAVTFTAQSVAQADGDLLIRTGSNAAWLNTSAVAGAGTIVLEGSGPITLSNHDGQALTLADSVDGRVSGGSETDRVLGGAGDDSLSGAGDADTLGGGAGADTLDGGDGDDRLDGGAGADLLTGGSGQDRLETGAGSDTLTGGADADAFVVSAGATSVLITDYEAANLLERIDVSGLGVSGGFGGLTITDTAQGAQVAFSGGSILLAGVEASELNAGDFSFGGGANVFQVAAGTNQSLIQELINGAPAGAVIELGAGVFTFTERLTINRGDITVRGAGAELTTIVSALSGPSETILVRALGDRNTVVSVQSTAVQGSSTLTLSSVAGIEVGEVIYVAQNNDSVWLQATGNTGLALPGDHDANPGRYALREALLEVTAISGNTVTLSHPLPFTFEGGIATVAHTPMLSNVELSGFTLTTTLGVADPLAYVNTLAVWNSVPLISIDSARDSRVSDIVLTNAYSNGFEFQRVFEVQGENLTVQGAHNKGGEGNGYGFYLSEAFAVSLTDIKAFDTRHAVLTSSYSAEHYNAVHVLETNRDINFHGGPDADNIVVVDKMVQLFKVGGDQWTPVGPGAFPIHPRSTVDANDVTFRHLRSGDLADKVRAHAAGGDLGTGVGADTLLGGAGNDTLDGGAGADSLTGGGGRDRFVRQVGSGADLITDFQAGPSGDVLILRGLAITSRADLALTQDGADVLIDFGQDGITRLQNVSLVSLTDANFGFEAVNAPAVVTAVGGAGFLLASDGDDQITIFRTQVTSLLPVVAGDGRDVVTVAVSNLEGSTTAFENWSGVDVLDLSPAAAVSLTFDPAIFAQSDDGDLTLRFAPGASVFLTVGVPDGGSKLFLEGAAPVLLSNSKAHAVHVSDVAAGAVTGGTLADTLTGGAQDDTLNGGGGNDSLVGGSGDDTLDGGVGVDTLSGGDGNDVYWLGSGDTIQEAGGGGVDEVRTTSAAYTLAGGAELERLTGLGANGQALTGNALANLVTGAGGADTLDGGAGADTLQGGAGDDIYLTDAADLVIEAGGQGADEVRTAAAAYTIGAGVERLTGLSGAGQALTGGDDANTVTGGAGVDTLNGGAGDDVLEGGAGADLLTGGAGIDMASYAGATAAVTINLAAGATHNTGGGGTDTYSGVEGVLGSAHGDALSGDGGANRFDGGGGNDTLIGGLGNDTLIGGAGVDLATWAGGASRVVANLTTGVASGRLGETDSLSGLENLTGTAFDDILSGDGGVNVLVGGAGADQLDGGTGDDTLDGGDGADTASYALAAAAVNVTVNWANQNTGGAGVDTLLQIENLSGSAFNDTLRGDSRANVLSGGLGDDVLNGGLGNDTLVGFGGLDTAMYHGLGVSSAVTVDLAITTAQNTGGGGVDTLSGIEQVIGTSFADVLRGSEQGNGLVGGLAGDDLDGRGGNDRLQGQGGDDTLIGGDGADFLLGGTEADRLRGDAGNDKLNGEDGADTLNGGAGADLLSGGAGADRFVYNNVTESTTAGGRDRISDFSVTGGDLIDLTLVDAVTGGGDDAFVLVSAFTGIAGQLRLTSSGKSVMVEGDVNGDGQADFAVEVVGTTPLTADDFAL